MAEDIRGRIVSCKSGGGFTWRWNTALCRTRCKPNECGKVQYGWPYCPTMRAERNKRLIEERTERRNR